METPTKTCISENNDLFFLKFPGIIYLPNSSPNVNFRLKPIIIQKGVFVWLYKKYTLRVYLPVIGGLYIYIYIYIYICVCVCIYLKYI